MVIEKQKLKKTPKISALPEGENIPTSEGLYEREKYPDKGKIVRSYCENCGKEEFYPKEDNKNFPTYVCINCGHKSVTLNPHLSPTGKPRKNVLVFHDPIYNATLEMPRKIRRVLPKDIAGQEFLVTGVKGSKLVAWDSRGCQQLIHWHNIRCFELVPGPIWFENPLRVLSRLRDILEKKVRGTGTKMDEFVYLGDIEDALKECGWTPRKV